MVLVIGLSFSKLKPSNQSLLLVHFLALRFLNYLHLVIHTRNCFYHSTVELRFSGPRLSGLFLWSQFGDEYLLVTIKIHGHVLFKTTALKSAVKCEGFLLSKSKALTHVVTNEEHDCLRVMLLLSEISRSMACLALYGKQLHNNGKREARR